MTIPNVSTRPVLMPSLSPTNGSPGRSRLNQPSTRRATAPRKTTAAMPSIHHQRTAMPLASGLCGERVDCFPQPARNGIAVRPIPTQAIFFKSRPRERTRQATSGLGPSRCAPELLAMPPRAAVSSGFAFEPANFLGLLLDPFLGSVQLFLLLALGFFDATLAMKRRIALQVTGSLLCPPGDLVNEAHRITSTGAATPVRLRRNASIEGRRARPGGRRPVRRRGACAAP